MVAPWTFGFPCAFLLFIHWPSRPVIGTDSLQDMTEGSGFNMLHVGVSNATLKSYHLFHCLALVAMLHDLDIDKSEFWMDCLLCIYQQVSPLILRWLPLTQHSSASSLGCERTRLACLLRIGAHTQIRPSNLLKRTITVHTSIVNRWNPQWHHQYLTIWATCIPTYI